MLELREDSELSYINGALSPSGEKIAFFYKPTYPDTTFYYSYQWFVVTDRTGNVLYKISDFHREDIFKNEITQIDWLDENTILIIKHNYTESYTTLNNRIRYRKPKYNSSIYSFSLVTKRFINMGEIKELARYLGQRRSTHYFTDIDPMKASSKMPVLLYSSKLDKSTNQPEILEPTPDHFEFSHSDFFTNSNESLYQDYTMKVRPGTSDISIKAKEMILQPDFSSEVVNTVILGYSPGVGVTRLFQHDGQIESYEWDKVAGDLWLVAESERNQFNLIKVSNGNAVICGTSPGRFSVEDAANGIVLLRGYRPLPEDITVEEYGQLAGTVERLFVYSETVEK
jgi:hypothetical protein